MENFFKFILFLIFVKLSFAIVPLWNFSASAIDLFGDNIDYEYYVTNTTLLEKSYYLSRKFHIENGILFKENHLYLQGEYYGLKNYSEIQSAYLYRDYYYICPKGKYHVDKINKNTRLSEKLDIEGINEEVDWDLQCFYQHELQPDDNDGHKFLFMFYI